MKTGIRSSVILFVVLSAGTKAQEILPYLQSPSSSSVWVTWKTESDTESIVFYGKDSLDLQRSDTGTCQILSDDGYNANYYYHSVRLTGLEPYQFYYYRTKTGVRTSAICRFRTQPPLGQKPGIYRFLILGDHQLKNSDRYERLMKAAREKVIEKFGGRAEDHIDLIINDGDQVDAGTLDQYEHVHFEQSAALSGNIPIMTTVGNHETYGSIGLPLYYAHFFYDGLGYKDIVSPGRENYYSYQEKNIVFIHLSSEHSEASQTEWVKQIIDSVKTDSSVDWVISVAHRPIQAEQHVGDISLYIREHIIPILAQTKKSVLFISGHHHLYARGQVRDFPIYHIISGAASWDQHWGQSTEKDFDDVQKTIDYWTYQIASFDGDKKEMTVESYAIGSPKLGFTLNNILIDSFYRKPDVLPPGKPSILPIPEDTITLPFTFVSSPYSSGTAEPYNSVQFQIYSISDFSKIWIDMIRDFENLYGTTGDPDYRPVDIYRNLDIFRYEISGNRLPNGTYFIRLRHRDRNNAWSEWSEPVKFIVKESAAGPAGISTSQPLFHPGEDIAVSYQSGPGNPKDWIGIYKQDEVPGTISSTDWSYVNGSSGTVNLQVSEPGIYFIAFFENDGYNELTDRISVYVISSPVLTLNKVGYAQDENIEIDYSQAPGLPNDWIGIYRISDTPGNTGSTLWKYTSGNHGKLSFTGLLAGYYFVTYFLDDGFTEACARIIFSVGTDLAEVSVNKSNYRIGQVIEVTFSHGPGTAADWIGILRQNAPPGKAPLVSRQFINNQQSGLICFDLSLDPGDYYASLFINNSNLRISNKANFVVESAISGLNQNSAREDFLIFPSPSDGRFRLRVLNLHGNVSVRISSLAGKIIFEKSIVISPAMDSEEIDVSRMPHGIYIISLRTGDKFSIKKLVLQ